VVSGTAMIVHVEDAGDGSVPTALTARTWNVWLPSARLEYACGLVHAANAAPSRAHSNVAPIGFDVKVKLALVLAVGDVGDDVIVVSGSDATPYVAEYAPACAVKTT